MLAYIAETIKGIENLKHDQDSDCHAATGGVRRPDPVCAAAAEAYFDAYIERKSEGEANEAAAVAYVDALDKVDNYCLTMFTEIFLFRIPSRPGVLPVPRPQRPTLRSLMWTLRGLAGAQSWGRTLGGSWRQSGSEKSKQRFINMYLSCRNTYKP